MITEMCMILSSENGSTKLKFENNKWKVTGRDELWPREIKLISALNELIKEFNSNEKSHTSIGNK